jgi:ribosomal-protein-alanine N-acetyltransferase
MLHPPPPYVLRPLRTADIDNVLAIESVSFPSSRSQALYHYELTQNRVARYHALVRQESSGTETLLGYAGYWILSDEIHISTIAVDPALRRKGLGELLLLNILIRGIHLGAALVTLEVRETNVAAQELYKKYHFDEVGLRKRYYRDTGEDAILMTVLLKEAPEYRAFLEERRDAIFHQLATAS